MNPELDDLEFIEDGDPRLDDPLFKCEAVAEIVPKENALTPGEE